MNITESIARAVGAPLGDAEHAWAQALRDSAAMVAALAQASLDARVPIAVSSEIVDQSLEGLAQLGAVGRSYASVHARMSALARKSGLDPSMYGESTGPSAMNVAAEHGVIVLAERRAA